MAWVERPDYVLHRYGHGVYKIVKFKVTRSSDSFYPGDKSDKKSYDHKLDNSFSRARSVCLQLALCNSWDWFCTFTLDPSKYDRFDLVKFNKDFSQFIRDKRKVYGSSIRFLLIPEEHADGAWHMHGLISGLPCSVLTEFVPGVHPRVLWQNGFKNWHDYADRFGFCSLGVIRDPVAVSYYLLKYLTKDLQRRVSCVGSHLYYCSQGLLRAEKAGERYGFDDYLDSLLTHDYDFCRIGMAQQQDWTIEVVHVDVSSESLDLQSLYLPESFEASWDPEFFNDFDYEQLVISDG